MIRKFLLAATVLVVPPLLAQQAQAGPAPPLPTSCSISPTPDITLSIASNPAQTLTPVACVYFGSAPIAPLTEITALTTSTTFTGVDSNSPNYVAFATDQNQGNGQHQNFTVNGIQFSISDDVSNGNGGSWQVSWTDVNGPAADNLPVTVNLEVGLYSGHSGPGFGYLFNGVVLPEVPNTGQGTFDLTFKNGGDDAGGLWDVVLAGGDMVQDPPNVPEPASLTLLGVGLLGLGVVTAKRRN